MGTATKIEWCDATASPWYGCTKVAEGCKFCYAEVNAKRNTKTLGVWGPNGTRVLSRSFRHTCLKLQRAAEKDGRRRRVFPSICDPFEDWSRRLVDCHGRRLLVCDSCGSSRADDDEAAASICDCGSHWQRASWMTLDDARREMFAVSDGCPQVDFLLLTKRPQNILRMWESTGTTCDCAIRRHNVWLGCSVSTQADADRDIPELLKCRGLAPVLFVSVEPLIERITLDSGPRGGPPRWMTGEVDRDDPQIDWVIIGGESGPKARPCNVAWVRSLVQQCHAADVPAFVKQLGADCRDDDPISRCSWPGLTHFQANRDEQCRVMLHDTKGGDPEEWPDDLRVREFPR